MKTFFGHTKTRNTFITSRSVVQETSVQREIVPDKTMDLIKAIETYNDKHVGQCVRFFLLT